jgi:RimJ/RimL family protein N-acetyltransferase
MDLSDWTPRPRPARVVLEGRHARLEPLDPARHGGDLMAAAKAAPDRFRWLFEDAPADTTALDNWLERVAASPDPLFWAVIDRATGRAEGRQALMRMDPANGVIEIGNILWGPAIAGTRVATEALYLHARHVFDDLGYRRFEWKCHDLNAPSKRAALRFGFAFEGVFRQHMVHKGANRDTAWFAMIDRDWPALRARFEAWLDPGNFDTAGRQRRRLQDCG